MTIDNRTPGQLLKEIAAERAKTPAVDHNGYPLSMGYTAPEWTINTDGLPLLTPPPAAPDPGTVAD